MNVTKWPQRTCLDASYWAGAGLSLQRTSHTRMWLRAVWARGREIVASPKSVTASPNQLLCVSGWGFLLLGPPQPLPKMPTCRIDPAPAQPAASFQKRKGSLERQLILFLCQRIQFTLYCLQFLVEGSTVRWQDEHTGDRGAGGCRGSCGAREGCHFWCGCRKSHLKLRPRTATVTHFHPQELGQE